MQPGALSDVTVVITACGRPDLLAQTIDSFTEYNDYPVAQYIITEDSGNPRINEKVRSRTEHLPIVWIEPRHRVGQIQSIDRAYAHVTTPYIFHLEEDWQFYRPGFLLQSKQVLETDPKVCNVWIREPGDRNGHPCEATKRGPGALQYAYMTLGYKKVWHGFTFNPGLRRLSEYQKIGPYAKLAHFDPANPAAAEAQVGNAYFRAGMRGATLLQGYVKHIGGGRHVKNKL
jgi:hypothetical protein